MLKTKRFTSKLSTQHAFYTVIYLHLMLVSTVFVLELNYKPM